MLPPRRESSEFELSEFARQVARGLRLLLYFLFGRFLGLPLQKEIEIAAHDKMRRQGDLIGSAGPLHQKLMQHAEGDLALCARTLVDGGSHGAGADFRDEIGEQVRRDDREAI